jgi:hypothetical protein
MPIAYAFPQGGGGGAPLPAPTFQPLGDLNGGGFTFSDPNSLVSSYSFAAGVHSFGLVTVNPAVGNYALNSAPNFTGPRWTQPLVDGTGAPVLAGDKFLMMVQLTDLDPGASRQWAAAWGVAKVPASTSQQPFNLTSYGAVLLVLEHLTVVLVFLTLQAQLQLLQRPLSLVTFSLQVLLSASWSVAQ